MNLSTIQANIISLVGVIVSLLVGLAVVDGETAQIITSTAGSVLSIAFSLFAELRTKTVAATGVAVKGVLK
jgi:hypothetical protein